jgi:hypothetical protein
MGFFPPNMYNPQINMIKKPFELNKEKLIKDFMSPKYENRRKEFFATFSEFLRNYIRDKYYEFMNDIQDEVNFFEWFDNYFKPKILAEETQTQTLSYKKKATHKVTYRYRPLTSQNTIIGDKTTTHTPPNILSSNPVNKKHACDTSHNSLLPLTTDNTHFATNQQDNIDLTKKQMQTINRTTQNWLKVENKEVVHEKFPPYESIIISHRNHQLVASPIKNVSLSDETKNFEKIIEQNNYSNIYLKVIGAKLDRIENKIDPIKPTTKLDIEKPLFTPHEIPPKLRVSFKKDNTNLLEEISKRLQTLDIINIASSSQNKKLTNQFKRINTIDKIKQDSPRIEKYIENLQNQFKDLDINRIANERDLHGKPLRSRIARTRYPENISITRNFHSRPTPSDLQFEERELTVRNYYNAESLYEWNIDGMSQYEILNELPEMLMISNVYKSNNKTDHQIAKYNYYRFYWSIKRMVG